MLVTPDEIEERMAVADHLWVGGTIDPMAMIRRGWRVGLNYEVGDVAWFDMVNPNRTHALMSSRRGGYALVQLARVHDACL